jgi:uncharacterized protein (DUF1778 family)
MTVILSPAAFDALLARLSRPGKYCPRVARVLSTPAPWEPTPNLAETRSWLGVTP